MYNNIDAFLTKVTRAYASFRLKRYDDAIKYLGNNFPESFDKETQGYLACVNKYVELLKSGIDKDKIKSIIGKFFKKSIFDRLYGALENGKTPYDEFLIECDFNCDGCKHRMYCCYTGAKELNRLAGKVYSEFNEGQSHEEFAL